MPFAQAQQLLLDWMKLGSLSEATVRRHTEGAGAAYVAIQEEEAGMLEQGGELPRDLPGSVSDRLVVEVDGAMAPLVGGEWSEVKTVVVGEVAEAADGEESGVLRKVSSFSRMTGAASFTRWALAETHRRGVDEWGQVALVSDGAEWIQGFGDFHCPGSARILDYPHAVGYVAEIGRGVFGEGSSMADEWQREQAHRLKHEGAGAVLPALRALVQSQETDLSKPLAYVEKRESQMRYRHFQAQGWPIGSGAVESANKLVVEARLKGGGMHWARPHVDPMLGLRNVVCSGRWAEEWPRIARRIRLGVRCVGVRCVGVRCGGRQALQDTGTPGETSGAANTGESKGKPRAVDEPEATVKSPAGVALSGELESSKPPRRPAANHPWRRSPIGHHK